MNGFRKMAARLRDEGWYVGWNEPCCQSCAWGGLPMYLDEDMEIEVDYSKVLFNHSQDCEVYLEGEECPYCYGEGMIQVDRDADEDDDDWMDCTECFGVGEINEEIDNPEEFDTTVSGFICNTPEQQNSSYFCFDGTEEGVENFKAVIPIIEECGVEVNWNGSGDSRIELSWNT